MWAAAPRSVEERGPCGGHVAAADVATLGGVSKNVDPGEDTRKTLNVAPAPLTTPAPAPAITVPFVKTPPRQRL